MNEPTKNPTSIRAAANWAILPAMLHASAWAVVFYIYLSEVPPIKNAYSNYIYLSEVRPIENAYSNYKTRMPWITEIVIDLSDALVDRILMPPLMLVLFTALDAAILFLLRRQRVTVLLAWIWFVLLLCIPIGLCLLCWLGLHLAHTELEFMKGLRQ